MIDGVLCVGRACDKQRPDAFQSSRLTGVRLCAVITLQAVWRAIGGRHRAIGGGHEITEVCEAYTPFTR